jgi:hypothetical protein
MLRLLLLLGYFSALLTADTVLDAHNCYPYEGKYADRLDRALALGTPIAIEQDLSWIADKSGSGGRIIVVHNKPYSGTEPNLNEHFFDKIRPLMEAALKDPRPSRWPLVTLNLDFKSEEPELLEAVWKLLQQHRNWLTTAQKPTDDSVADLTMGPLMVLTGSSRQQKQVFYDRLKVGEEVLLFGSALVAKVAAEKPTWADVARFQAATPAATLISEKASAYIRWVNFPWNVVELGGQPTAAEWNAREVRRLKELVEEAHSRGLRIRFYTLNGHPKGKGLGWSETYNFGELDAAEVRWKAAIGAGVDFLATDQYEEFAAFQKSQIKN